MTRALFSLLLLAPACRGPVVLTDGDCYPDPVGTYEDGVYTDLEQRDTGPRVLSVELDGDRMVLRFEDGRVEEYVRD